MSTADPSPFSCDLVTNSFLHRHFLEQIHELGVSHLSLPYQSLRRYRDLWLPLVHQNSDAQLIPPPDIAWLWHCHRLAPQDYIHYVTKRFGCNDILEASPPFALQTPEVLQYKETASAPTLVTRLLWEKTYSKEQPFFLSETNNSNLDSTRLGSSVTIGGFDLIGSTKRQATFLWQISGERFNDLDFLEQGRDTYLKFLKLRLKAGEQRIMLVPTFQIDLMWHTHMLTSLTKYNRDCMAIMGSTFHHDDSHSDRTPGGVLDNSYHETTQLWRKEYGENYVVPGGMYRGEPPASFFLSSNYKDLPVSKPLTVMGASSTSPPPQPGPLEWAKINGLTSDGSSAFKKASGHLQFLPHRENYVLGRTAVHGVGYYHFETREANVIIATRVSENCRRLEHSIAMEQGCCGGSGQRLLRYEQQLGKAKDLHREMQSRCNAKRPGGTTTTTTTSTRAATNRGMTSTTNDDHIGNNGGGHLCSSTGAWLYPPMRRRE